MLLLILFLHPLLVAASRQNLHQIWEHDHILELARQPDQVEGVLVDADLVGQRGGIV